MAGFRPLPMHMPSAGQASAIYPDRRNKNLSDYMEQLSPLQPELQLDGPVSMGFLGLTANPDT